MIRPLDPDDAARVAANMRETDRKEICGLAYTDDPVEAIAPLRVLPCIGATAWRGGEPISAIGAMWLWPGVVSVFMFATPRWPEVALQTTRFVKRILLPALRDAGVHRLECYSLAENKEAHHWLRYLGADREVAEPEYGKNREDYVLFSMSRARLEEVTSVEKCDKLRSLPLKTGNRGSGPCP